MEAHDAAIAPDRCGAPWASVEGIRIPVSLSHSGGWAAAAAHLRTRVGIDVEPAQEIPPHFARYFLWPDEIPGLAGWEDPPTALLAAWTVKEAVLKATGRGLSVPPSTVRIRRIDAHGRASVTLDGAEVAAASWREEGAVVAVACAGRSDLPALSVSSGAM